MNNWPDETRIDATGHNGECDEPVYEMLGHLYRINPVNNYAIVWTGKKWTESQRITNDMVRLNGWVKK
jgi:hypothetical protein